MAKYNVFYSPRYQKDRERAAKRGLDVSKLDEDSVYVIVKSDFAIAGELPTVVDMPDGWQLKFSKDKKSITLSKKRGLLLLLR